MNVLKLGGSLLTVPDLIPRLLQTIADRQLTWPLVIVGGGTAADSIRDLQARLQFSDSEAHWLAIHAMQQNSVQLCRLDRRLRLTGSREETAAAWHQGSLPVLDCLQFLQAEEQGILQQQPATGAAWEHCLPATWDVTSDSIAAWIAARWPAHTLWLLKSCAAADLQPTALQAAGLVDRFFPQTLAPGLQLRWLDSLRQGPTAT